MMSKKLSGTDHEYQKAIVAVPPAPTFPSKLPASIGGRIEGGFEIDRDAIGQLAFKL